MICLDTTTPAVVRPAGGEGWLVPSYLFQRLELERFANVGRNGQFVGRQVPSGGRIVDEPDEIAEMVVLLLSPRSGVVTGSVIDWDQIVIGGHD